MTLQEFLKTRDVELTLTNMEGEVYYAGKAESITGYDNGKHHLKFPAPVTFDNVHPFNKAILHGGRKIFSAINIVPIRPQKEQAIELIY